MTAARHPGRLATTALAVSLITGALLPATSPATAAAAPEACDLYASGGTPCVAAHSTTRALYAGYRGKLYQVRRASDGATRDIRARAASGVAAAPAQDAFCAGTTCVVTVVYDQSGHGNDLTPAPPGDFRGPAAGGYDAPGVADAAPVRVRGKKAYGILVSPGTGYRNNATKGIARGDEPEGMYAVFDGTHYNGGCCFDYGNAETNSRNNGNGTMEALYFGSSKGWGWGAGKGPWIMADFENGLFSGADVHYNAGDPTITDRFVTAVLKGEPHHWALRGGNAQGGPLSTFYDGRRPNANGYDPMKKEGAIILGIGGDNSVSARGTFYEGVMTAGYPSDATENAVQASIVAARYTAVPVKLPRAGSVVSLRATTACCTNRSVAHTGADVVTAVVDAGSSQAVRASATWTLRRGLANRACLSFESRDTPGSYLRHYDYRLTLARDDGSAIMHADATFCPERGRSGQGVSFAASNYPDRYLRHYDNVLYVASNGGPNTFDAAGLWAEDVSWIVGPAWAA